MVAVENIARLAEYQEQASERRNSNPLTEDTAALEFASRHSGKLLYCHDRGAWHTWTGAHWRVETTGLAFEWARQLVRELADMEERRTRTSAGKTTFAAGVERFARSDRAFAVTSESWDCDPWLIGTPGGTIDLRTGLMREARQEDRITKITAVAPAPTINCPRWLLFLAQATGNDRGMVRFLQQWCGYCLTGVTREHALVFVFGPGGNGKGVFMHVLTSILGPYAVTSAMETFVASHGDRHPTELAMLHSARLVTASETEKGRAWAEARIKALTGGDPITAHFMRQDDFTFTPLFKLTIVGNHKPMLHTVDDAARRRFNIVPFIIQPKVPDKELEVKLEAEWPGILRWMIEGCLDWQANGLVRPESIIAATQGYFSDQDLFGQWIEDRCELHPGSWGHFETSADLYASWHKYATDAGDKPGNQKSFAEMLIRRGAEPHRTKAHRTYRYITLRDLGTTLGDG